MLEDEIFRLNSRDKVDLDGLETKIWSRERHVRARQAATRNLASWQGFVLVLSVVGSAAMGATVTLHQLPQSSFIAEEAMAPSNLLLGSRQ